MRLIAFKTKYQFSVWGPFNSIYKRRHWIHDDIRFRTCIKNTNRLQYFSVTIKYAFAIWCEHHFVELAYLPWKKNKKNYAKIKDRRFSYSPSEKARTLVSPSTFHMISWSLEDVATYCPLLDICIKSKRKWK